MKEKCKAILRGRLSIFGFMLIAGVAATFPSLLVSQSLDSILTRGDAANIDVVASRIADRIEDTHVSESHPSVVVIDFFRGSPGTSSALGSLLADRFSNSLVTFSKSFRVVDRKVLGDYLTRNWTTLEDLQSRELCLELARQLGAYGALIGTIYEENGVVAMKIHLEGFGPPKKKDILQDSDEVGRIAATQPITDLLFQKGPNYFRGPDDVPREPGVFVAGVDGVGMPSCVYCPDPPYSDAARRAKMQGTVKLSVVVTEDGKATSIYVLKGAPFGLTAQAVKTIQSWQFRAAQKDAKPVGARVPIEVTFRLF